VVLLCFHCCLQWESAGLEISCRSRVGAFVSDGHRKGFGQSLYLSQTMRLLCWISDFRSPRQAAKSTHTTHYWVLALGVQQRSTSPPPSCTMPPGMLPPTPPRSEECKVRASLGPCPCSLLGAVLWEHQVGEDPCVDCAVRLRVQWCFSQISKHPFL